MKQRLISSFISLILVITFISALFSVLQSQTVQAQDGFPADLSVNVHTAANDTPSAVPDSYRVLSSQPFTVTTPGVLANDTDVDGDIISATLISDVTSGTLSLALDGSFIYTPAVSSGVDSFTYAATDGISQSNTTTVTLTLVSAAPFGTCADFETGTLPDYFLTETTSNNGANGRVRVSANYPYNGNYAMTIDTDCDGCGGNTTQAGIMVVDLSGATEADLSFWVQEFSDENHAADGVFISDDGGATWAQILSLNGYPENYTLVDLDLDEAVTTAGMSLVDNFLIKFQSEDNFTTGADGYAFDDICVRTPQPDANASPLAGGQYRDEVVTRTLQIDNSGTLSLTWNLSEAETDCAAPGDLSWLTALTTTGDINPFDSFNVDVAMGEASLTAGTHSGLLCLNSDDPDTPTCSFLPFSVWFPHRIPLVEIDVESDANGRSSGICGKFAGVSRLRVWEYVANSPHRIYRKPKLPIDVETDANGRFSGKVGEFATSRVSKSARGN